MKIGYSNIIKHEQVLKEYFLKHVDLTKIVLYTPSVNSPLITFNVFNDKHQIIDGQDIEYYLDKKGIFCRSSLSCAKLACYPQKKPTSESAITPLRLAAKTKNTIRSKMLKTPLLSKTI